jgi:stearoyl-CoA desaturase (delta-9 desaturase)
MAIFTFGEGYHNYHHEFQHDYRNGVKPRQFDPTKWIIWTLAKVGLAQKLRTVSSEKILLAELAEAQRRMESKLGSPDLTDAAREYISHAYARLQTTMTEWAQFKDAQMEITREMLIELRAEVRAAMASLNLRDGDIAAVTTSPT